MSSATNPSLLEQYNVVFKSKEVDQFSDAQFIFLGSDHASIEGKKLNGQFIEQNSYPQALLVLEGLSSSLGIIKDKNQANELFLMNGVDSSAASRIALCGWDIAEISQLEKAFKKSNRGISQALERIHSLKQEQSGLGNAAQVDKNRDDLSKVEEIYEKLVRNKLELILTAFPLRTLSINESLVKIEKWIAETNFKGKVIFIEGAWHLQTPKEYEKDERLSLKIFYEELALHKAIALIPKLIKV